MPAPKPKSQHRIPLVVSCSVAQKEQIDEVLAKIPPRRKSKYILSLIEKAIASGDTNLAEESYTHNTNVQFQVSCSPEEKKKIDNYCDRYLPKGKRSRWIVNIILVEGSIRYRVRARKKEP